MNDLVSVIVPVFNRRGTILRALESIRNQTYAGWEAIVVDDGSTDDTARVVAEYIRGEPRFRLIRHDQRKGAQASRNAGNRAAGGKWIAFLDSDDRLLPGSLEVRLRVAEEKGVQVVHSDCYVLRPGADGAERLGICPLQGDVYKQLLQQNGPMFQALLVSKDALIRIGYLDETIISYQEWDTAIRLAKHYEFAFVSDPTFIYDCRHFDSVFRGSRPIAMGYEQVFRKHMRSIFLYAGPLSIAYHAREVAARYREVDRAKSVRYLLLSIILCPLRPRAILRRVRHLFATLF